MIHSLFKCWFVVHTCDELAPTLEDMRLFYVPDVCAYQEPLQILVLGHHSGHSLGLVSKPHDVAVLPVSYHSVTTAAPSRPSVSCPDVSSI